jgi:transcriptional repressor NrdR
MNCPYCKFPESKVVDKRGTANGEMTRRRRECLSCHKRFTTYEKIELVNLTVIKKNGGKEPFDKNKVELGILKACEKRPVEREKIKKICDEIEFQLRNRKTTEIPSRLIGDMIMKRLKKLDQVAYVRFASVYKEFKDVESFNEELKALKKGG